MSGYSDKLEKGLKVLYKNKLKIVKDWFFVSDDGCPNSDLIVIVFEDNTSSKHGFKHIKYLDDEISGEMMSVEEAELQEYLKEKEEIKMFYRCPCGEIVWLCKDSALCPKCQNVLINNKAL